MQNCPQCGRENAPGAKFCVHCGAALAAHAAPPPPPQGGYGPTGYQPPYRAPRQPFTGNLLDHWPFVLVVMFTILASLALATNGDVGVGAGGPRSVWTNGVLLFLFDLIYFVVGLVGLTGAVGLLRLLDWSKWFVALALAFFAFDGMLLVIGGSISGLGGSEIARAILSGLVQVGLSAFGVYYVMSYEVASRLRHSQ